jgi:hypothetical protein
MCTFEVQTNAKTEIMTNSKAVNPTTLSDTNDFKFKPFNVGHIDQIDVMHRGNRVAIINGLNGAALRWVCNSDKISIKNIDKLENMIKRAVKKSIKIEFAK